MIKVLTLCKVSLSPLHYEPEIERCEEVYNPSDKRGWLWQVPISSMTKTHEKFHERHSMKDLSKNLKRRWVVLRKIVEDETTTGYQLDCFKDEREEQKGNKTKNTYFLAEPIFEAEAFTDESRETKKRH